MGINIVYCDLDGVLVDFLSGLHKALDVPHQYDPYPYEKNKWDILDDGDLTFKAVNDACTTDFWQNLDWMHDGYDILKLILQYFKPEQIYLLTTPMPNPGSATGKTLWVEKRLPKYKKRLIITQASKSLFAKPDTLLIDDKTENVDDFIEAGGYGLLVPRPWNIDYGMADYTMQIVEERLEEYPICQES